MSSLHCAIATVGADGMPHITPIGTVFLHDEPRGFFFDRYTSTLATHLAHDNRVCLLAVNSGRLFWLRSLLRARFASAPGVRLYGTVGPLREASTKERHRVQARTRASKWMKGSRLLWGDFTHVRDIEFSSFRPVSYPVMMEGLWDAPARPDKSLCSPEI